jgi:hypothetical protein
MERPHPIDLTETASGEWSKPEDQPRGTNLEPVDKPAEIQPRRSAVDDIPNLGSPIEFITGVVCLGLLMWWFRG